MSGELGSLKLNFPTVASSIVLSNHVAFAIAELNLLLNNTGIFHHLLKFSKC